MKHYLHKKKLFAFTLAEVLITLGIIGVVAAMTMPALVAKYRSLVAVTQLKKMYSVISQAMVMSVPDGDYNNIPISDGGTPGATNFFNDYMKPQFKIIKTCYGKDDSCLGTIKDKSGKSMNLAATDRINIITSDGYAINVDTWNSQDYTTIRSRYGVNVNGTSPILVLYIDINGKKNPNIIGKDIFVFVLAEKGLKPAGSDADTDKIQEECKNTGYYCFAKIIKNNWTISPEDVW